MTQITEKKTKMLSTIIVLFIPIHYYYNSLKQTLFRSKEPIIIYPKLLAGFWGVIYILNSQGHVNNY